MAVVGSSLATISTRQSTEAERARTSAPRFALLAVELAILVALAHASSYSSLDAFLAFPAAGALVSYWLPIALKRPFWIGLAFVATGLLIPPIYVVPLAVIGIIPYFVARQRPRPRVLYAAFFGVALAAIGVGRLADYLGLDQAGDFVELFGSLFGIRLLFYANHVRHAKTLPTLVDYLAYVFAMPSLMHFQPFIDYDVMSKAYLKRDIHDIAQNGVRTMTLGLLQMAMWGVIEKVAPMQVETVHTVPQLAAYLVLAYTRLIFWSGIGHIIVGIFMLYGYDMPALNNNYALATSPLDFWRRNNIYLKEMMMKLVYLPVYFYTRRRMRDGLARVVTTAVVFSTMWALGIYLAEWTAAFTAHIFNVSNTGYRISLGLGCTINAYLIIRANALPKQYPLPRRILQIGGTLLFMSLILPFEWTGSSAVWLGTLKRVFFP